MKIFNGKKEKEKILADLKRKIKRQKLFPCLAVILVGKNPESLLYLRNKKEAAKKIGMKFICCKFPASISQEKIIKKIKVLNNTFSVDGIIVQLPLPKKFNASKIIDSINPQKDIDGFCQKNRELLKKGKPYFLPVLPWAIFIVLRTALSCFKGKKIIALVNSDIFGKTIQLFFKKKGIKINYLLGSIKKNISELKSADVIISVKGEPYFLKGDMIKKNSVLVDGGIRVVGKKVLGDIDKESVARKASFLTPVPGGIGALTVALLLKNVYLAAKLKNKLNN